jgi:hypothetical protein
VLHLHRRRDWPTTFELTFAGFSIGKWIDEDGDGKFDVLEVETRFMKGLRALDATGLPVHMDNQTVVKGGSIVTKSRRTFSINEMTTIDNAFTRP